jgi:CRISPR type III-A-associated protein Csm2
MNNYRKEKDFGYKKQQQQVENQLEIKFRDENGNLRRELLTTEAESIAKSFERSGLTNTQLRKFYNEVKALQAQIEATEGNDEEKFKKNEALIAMLKSKVAYARHRPQGEKIEELKKFIDACVDKIHSLQDFKDFTIFFEAVVGFAKLR